MGKTIKKLTWRIAEGAFFILAVAGCATTSVERNYELGNEEKNGIVAVSVSHDLVGGQGASALFYIDGGVPEGGSMLRSSIKEITGSTSESELKDSHGHLVVFALPPGEHAIDYWQITNGTGLRVLPRVKPTPLTFQVVRGQVTYLGNLHANLATGKNLFGITIVGNGYPEVRDRRQRDLELLERRYPQFKGKVAIDLLRLGPWTAPVETRKNVDIVPLPNLK